MPGFKFVLLSSQAKVNTYENSNFRFITHPPTMTHETGDCSGSGAAKSRIYTPDGDHWTKIAETIVEGGFRGSHPDVCSIIVVLFP